MPRRPRIAILLGWILLAGGCPQAAAPTPADTPTPSAPSGSSASSPSAAGPSTATPEPADTAPSAASPPLQRAGSIEYLEIVLGDAKPDEKLPMIVAIHGLGDRPDNFAHVFDTFPERARLILPRGIDPVEGGGYSWFPLRARDPDIEALSTGIGHAADEIADAIGELKAQRPTTGAPIVTGFSQGGMLTFAIAVRHPEVVGAALPIGGWLPPPLLPGALRTRTDYPPIEAFHGTDDRAVTYEPTLQSVKGLQSLGLTVELHTYEGVGHVITPEIHRDLTDEIVDAVRRAS